MSRFPHEIGVISTPLGTISIFGRSAIAPSAKLSAAAGISLRRANFASSAIVDSAERKVVTGSGNLLRLGAIVVRSNPR